MSAAKTGFTTFPDWGSYAKDSVGLYYLLDKVNFYAVTFPLSVKISSNAARLKGKYQDNVALDQLYFTDRFDPNGTYWRYTIPLTGFGSTGNITIEICKYDSKSYFLYITCNNTSGTSFTVEVSLFASAHAAMVSYNGSTLVQNHIANSGSNYVGATWNTQSTKAAIIGSDLVITPQDIQDSDFTTALESASNPYVGNGVGRTTRAKITWTANANSLSNHVFAVSVDASEVTAAANVAAVLSGYVSVLLAAQNAYYKNRSSLVANKKYGGLVERLLAESLHMVKYVNIDAAGVYKLVNKPGLSYSLLNNVWYPWDSAWTALAWAEAGYWNIAKDMINYPFGTDGTWLQYTDPPNWFYVVWRIYQITADQTILTNYYAALKSRYAEFKSQFLISGTNYKWAQNNDSGMDNGSLFTDPTGVALNSIITPCWYGWAIWAANNLIKIAAIASPGDVASYQSDIASWKTNLNALYNSSDGYFWGVDTANGNVAFKHKCMSCLLALLSDGISSDKVSALRNDYLNDLNNNNEVLTTAIADSRYINITWAGPSWNSTNFLVALGFWQNGDMATAQLIAINALANWNDLISADFRENRLAFAAGFGGTSHFISHNLCLVPMLKTSQPIGSISNKRNRIF